MPDTPVLFKVAACLHEAAITVLDEAGYRPPERGTVTHKGPDYECENCESLWVWIEDTVPDFSQVSDDPCVTPMERTFIVELAYPVCTEALTPCVETPPIVWDDSDPGCSDGGCPTIQPKIGDGKCGEAEQPSIPEESAYVWGARYELETKLPKFALGCVVDCAGLRCRKAKIASVTQITEGGCVFITLRLTLAW